MEDRPPGHVTMDLGIACASGSYKGVFVHGVLDSFEEAGLHADVYAAASSSTVCAAYAAARCVRQLGGSRYWVRAWESYVNAGCDVSTAVLNGIRELLPTITDLLFQPGAARFCVAVSGVTTEEAAAITQGPGARRLGQQLVLATRHRDSSWARANLAAVLFDTRAEASEGAAGIPSRRLTATNLAEVAYATTRMLHAWKVPAWIDGAPFVDASYTCSCPAAALAAMGCRELIVVSPEAGPVFTDFFQSATVVEACAGIRPEIIQPERNLAEIGVDYLKATEDGMRAAYAEGRRAGDGFLAH